MSAGSDQPIRNFLSGFSNDIGSSAGMLGHQEYLIRQIPGMRVDYISIKYFLFGKEFDGDKCQNISFLGKNLMAIFPFWEEL